MTYAISSQISPLLLTYGVSFLLPSNTRVSVFLYLPGQEPILLSCNQHYYPGLHILKFILKESCHVLLSNLLSSICSPILYQSHTITFPVSVNSLSETTSILDLSLALISARDLTAKHIPYN